jgi:error-prone DNA polymerase
MAYVELLTMSNFSFLRGASHPGELVHQAAELGLGGVGLCDRNSFAGVVRGHIEAREIQKENPDFRYLVGIRLAFSLDEGSPEIAAYPTDLAAYGRLCLLLTTGNRRAEKGDCKLSVADLLRDTEGILFIVLAEPGNEGHLDVVRQLRGQAKGRVWIAASVQYKGHDRARLNELAHNALQCRVPLIAVNDVIYHTRRRRPLQDVLTCIRLHTTIFRAGRRLEPNAERELKSHLEMRRLFVDHPDPFAETERFAARISFSLDQLRYNYPEETIGTDETAQDT